MDTAFEISAAGLDAQRIRLNIISSNLANVESTRTPEGGPFRRRDVVFTAAPAGSSFDEALSDRLENRPQGVAVSKIVLDSRPFRKAFEPQHPDADSEGYVQYPNVNTMEEMVNMISALRSYEANVTALNATKSMAMKALEIGR